MKNMTRWRDQHLYLLLAQVCNMIRRSPFQIQQRPKQQTTEISTRIKYPSSIWNLKQDTGNAFALDSLVFEKRTFSPMNSSAIQAVLKAYSIQERDVQNKFWRPEVYETLRQPSEFAQERTCHAVLCCVKQQVSKDNEDNFFNFWNLRTQSSHRTGKVTSAHWCPSHVSFVAWLTSVRWLSAKAECPLVSRSLSRDNVMPDHRPLADPPAWAR